MERASYPSDLSDAEWNMLKAYIPEPKSGGRPAKHDRREIVNAIAYLVEAGCSWRMLPHDLPPWKTVYDYFTQWRKSGIWVQVNEALRTRLRITAGREAQPSAAIIDSQSVKTTQKGGLVAMTPGKKSRDANAILW